MTVGLQSNRDAERGRWEKLTDSLPRTHDNETAAFQVIAVCFAIVFHFYFNEKYIGVSILEHFYFSFSTSKIKS